MGIPVLAIQALSGGAGGSDPRVDDLLKLIPVDASESNPLTDKAYVDGRVVSNPSAPGTRALAKLQIGETVFNIVGKAYSAMSYSALVSLLNAASAGEYETGVSVFIVTTNVPDLWIYSNNEATSVPYTYTTDAQFLADIDAGSGVLQVGRYKIAKLEGEKVDLTNYVQKTDYASSSNAGVGKVSQTYGIKMVSNTFAIHAATSSEIQTGSNQYHPITPSNLQTAVDTAAEKSTNFLQVTYYDVGGNTAHHAKVYMKEID